MRRVYVQTPIIQTQSRRVSWAAVPLERLYVSVTEQFSPSMRGLME